jgi:ferredoxin
VCWHKKNGSCKRLPVDCIHPRKDEEDFEKVEMLYIDPDDCIDCGACVPECPVTAIFPNKDVPKQWRQFIDRNAHRFKLSAAAFQDKYGTQGKSF